MWVLAMSNIQDTNFGYLLSLGQAVVEDIFKFDAATEQNTQ